MKFVWSYFFAIVAVCGVILAWLESNAITFWINFLLVGWYVWYLLVYHLAVILLIMGFKWFGFIQYVLIAKVLI